MTFKDCIYCRKETAHEKKYGIGTLILFIITFGFWILTMPFYPSRCIHCGGENV